MWFSHTLGLVIHKWEEYHNRKGPPQEVGVLSPTLGSPDCEPEEAVGKQTMWPAMWEPGPDYQRARSNGVCRAVQLTMRPWSLAPSANGQSFSVSLVYSHYLLAGIRHVALLDPGHPASSCSSFPEDNTA